MKKPKGKARPPGLCFRCEYRAMFLESGHGPRCECGDVQSGGGSCYQFAPVLPPVLHKTNYPGNLRRSIAAPAMLRARCHAVRLARSPSTAGRREPDVALAMVRKRHGDFMLMWV